MTQIRGIYREHPVTGERGVWISPASRPRGTYIGVAEKDYPQVNLQETPPGEAIKIIKGTLQQNFDSLMPSTDEFPLVWVFHIIQFTPLALSLRVHDIDV